MGQQIGSLKVGVGLAAALLVVSGGRTVFAQKAPPSPPIKVTKFPKATSRPPVPKIIRLAPGQKRITAEQMRKAPTVYAANRRGNGGASKSPSGPALIRVPGSPPILRNVLPDDSKPVPSGRAPKKPAAKSVPGKTAAKSR